MSTRSGWNHLRARPGRSPARLVLILVLCFFVILRTRQRRPPQSHDNPAPARPAAAASNGKYVPAGDEGLGAAVAIMVDNSGSMRDKAGDDRRPKYQVARQALEEMLASTDSFAARSEGAVRMYFVAFDVDAKKFAFLHDVHGEVLGAGNALALRASLDTIYRGRILAEAVDAGESLPDSAKSSSPPAKKP